MRKTLALAVALLLGSPAAPAAAPTAAQAAAVAEAQRIGRDIYDFDQAAWGSTDALVAAIPDPGAQGVRGWIVEREPGGTIAFGEGTFDFQLDLSLTVDDVTIQGAGKDVSATAPLSVDALVSAS